MEIHAADVATPALAAFARSGSYNERQVRRFTQLWEINRTREVPRVEEVGARLAAGLPEQLPATVVHGDFRLGNVIVDEHGLAAILDWELAHVGDPMEDLGWLCVKAWRFGGDLPVAGLGAYDDLFAAYSDASGRPVDPDVVRWWEVLGTLKWGIMCIMQANAHLSGASRSHELAAIGRRVCENEYDLLALMG